MLAPTSLLCYVLSLLLIIQTFIFWRSPASKSTPAIAPQSGIASPASSANASDWRFEPARDASNIALTAAQCDFAFPKLYAEVDRSVKFWRDKDHRISANDTRIRWRRDAAFRLLIHDNSLRILETRDTMNGPYRPRTLAVLHQLHQALLGATVSGEVLPPIQFAVTVDDMSLIPNVENDTHAIWSFTRRLADTDQERCWMIPDFNFWAGPDHAGSFYDAQARARRQNAYMLDKIPKAVWRGVVWTNQAVRGGLLQAVAGKPWADVAEVVWATKANFMPLEDLCRYAFVIHTEGRSWSGRLKYLLNCDSVPVVHKMDWTTHYYHLLVPAGAEQNHIPVRRDWADLEKKVQRYLTHLPASQKIADRAIATFRDQYLTPAAEACYWRRLVHGYSEVSEKPEVFEAGVGDGALDKVRGISFEEFVLAQEEWPPSGG
ncbi:hypothetical protein LTR53_017181 [Teratosphaeriaceae sp. CCFEE 6253]|nr:hypothetical protein LTR53_017181 [Teratosphaeriaceae sp. CCFEE 6253]